MHRWMAAAGLCAMAALSNLIGARPAFATFSGSDGQIVYKWIQPSSGQSATYLYTVGGAQPLTPPNGNIGDSSPKYSPDGTQIVFIEEDDTIQIMNADGTNRRTVLTTSNPALPPFPANFLSVTWLSDGFHLAVSVQAIDAPYLGGIFEFALDGSGVTRIVPNLRADEQAIFELDGSPVDDGIAFRCHFRLATGSVSFLRDDYCLFAPNTGVVELPVEQPGFNNLSPPHFTPDGTSLVFAMHYTPSDQVTYSIPSLYSSTPAAYGTTSYTRGEIFEMSISSGALTQLTLSPPIVWYFYSSTSFGYGVSAQITFDDAMMSPDSGSIVAHGVKMSPNATEQNGIFTFDLGAGPQSGNTTTPLYTPAMIASLPLFGTALASPDWQALPSAPTFIMQDGHGNPLKGLQLKLLSQDGKTVIDGAPLNPESGRYVLTHLLGPGTYDLRAVLTDNCQGAGCTPWFDILYGPQAAAGPVQADFTISLTAEDFPPGPITIDFADSESTFVSSNIGTNQADLDNLDDMADIYFRVRQYTDWIQTNLAPLASPPTAHLDTFATADPVSGQSVGANQSYYKDGTDIIVIGTADAAYEDRDGTTGDAPENVEWHEFTHHLWYAFVNPSPCTGAVVVNHGGYNNSNSCDSLKEGFAAFLPTLAGQDILPTTSADYDHVTNLELNHKAWWYRASGSSDEDLAVASLFWDLIDSSADTEASFVFGKNGGLVPVIYSDKVNMSLSQLWSQLTAAAPITVEDLYHTFGPQTPTIDLDGDGTNDVSLIDEVFLMHGFFPTDQHQSTSGHDLPFYDVAYAQRADSGSAVDADVGLTSHNLYSFAGIPVGSLVPRFNYPLNPNATVEINVVDTNGAPVQGATLHMVFHYPDSLIDTVDVPLHGTGGLIQLKLPPYFDYSLAAGAALPACNPATDLYADVTLSAQAGSQSSTQTVTLDNCTYLSAVMGATAPPALAYSFTIPAVVPPTYSLTLTTSGTGSGSASGAGTYPAGQSVLVSEIPNAGSLFSGWSGPNGTECATGTVVMSANKSCIANFTTLLTVPDVVGDAVGAATSAITGAGLTIGTQTLATSYQVPAGRVVSESPAAGTLVAPGAAVNLVVSSGPMRGDLNGDGQVDKLDLAIITSALNQPASGPGDVRDLNGDGVINALDARILVTLCTHPGCATQ
jgi:Dockerin type I domain/PASTA domain/Divergent InlB B-repeat domain